MDYQTKLRGVPLGKRPPLKEWVIMWAVDLLEEQAARQLPAFLRRLYPARWGSLPVDIMSYFLAYGWENLPADWKSTIMLRLQLVERDKAPGWVDTYPTHEGVSAVYSCTHNGECRDFTDTMPDICEVPLAVHPREKEAREKRAKWLEERMQHRIEASGHRTGWPLPSY